MSKVVMPFIDASGEKSDASMYVDSAISDANITALTSAVDGLTLGNRQKTVFQETSDKDAGTLGAASSKLAQRENKFLVKSIDQVNGKVVQHELPTADLLQTDGGASKVDLAAGVGLALKTAFDANVLSIDGNAISVYEVEFVGRNL